MKMHTLNEASRLTGLPQSRLHFFIKRFNVTPYTKHKTWNSYYLFSNEQIEILKDLKKKYDGVRAMYI